MHARGEGGRSRQPKVEQHSNTLPSDGYGYVHEDTVNRQEHPALGRVRETHLLTHETAMLKGVVREARLVELEEETPLPEEKV